MSEERTTGPGGVCPPHRWQLSNVAIEGARYDHHECTLCGAQKDVPQTSGAWRSTWTRRGSADGQGTARRRVAG